MKVFIFAMLAAAALAFPVGAELAAEVFDEYIPDLRLPCVCPAPSCPPFLSAKSVGCPVSSHGVTFDSRRSDSDANV